MSETPTRARIYVPTRGYVWYETVAALSDLSWKAAAAGEQIPIAYTRSKTGVVEVRNLIMRLFMDTHCETLIMVDDDVIPHPESLRLIDWVESGDADVVGVPTPIVRPGLPVLPNVYRVNEAGIGIDMELVQTTTGLQPCGAVGFGVVAISRRAIIKVGEFKAQIVNGEMTMGEDIDFCVRARKNGLKVAVDLDLPAEHVLTVRGNALATSYAELMRNAQDPTPVDV